jgi:hypothetical protein
MAASLTSGAEHNRKNLGYCIKVVGYNKCDIQARRCEDTGQRQTVFNNNERTCVSVQAREGNREVHRE